jgi:O-acetylserine/cysteine efflux transporter
VHKRLTRSDFGWVLVIVTLWGFAFVPIKWALADVPPFMLAALRFLFAAVPAAFVVSRPQLPWRTVVAYGIAIGVVQFGLLFLGMQLGMPAGLSSLVIQLQVFFTIALAVAFTDDRLHRWNVAGALVAIGGVVVLAAYKVAGGLSAPLAGFLFVVVAAFGWGVGNVIAKRAKGVDMFALVVWSSFVPPPILAAVSFVVEGPQAFAAVANASALAWFSILFLAWGATLFGFSRWNRLLQRYPSPLISPFALLIPVSGLASGALLLGERLSATQAVGVMLVFAGLAINVYGPAIWARWRIAARARRRRAPRREGRQAHRR